MCASTSFISTRYHSQGFVHLPGFFDSLALAPLQESVQRFHAAWMLENADLYRTRAINSAGLTSPRHLNTEDRNALFTFVAQRRVGDVLNDVFAGPAAFMNTQLFFNPLNTAQRNYWHRDIQYTGMAIAEQQHALGRSNVVHLRVALRPEPGLELVPGTHLRWDTPEEFAVRLALEGRKHCDALAGAQQIALQPGDLLVFSANMLHRGLYGMDRLAFDMLFCDPEPALLAHVPQECLPDAATLAIVDCPALFLRAKAAEVPAT